MKNTRAGFLSVLAMFFWVTTAIQAGGVKEPPALVIEKDRLREHVSVLSSDAVQGRATGEPGIAAVETYIAERFEEAGLVPLPGADGYFLNFDLYRNLPDETETFIRIPGENRPLVIGEDFKPFPFSGSNAVEAEAVYAGYGITAPEYSYDDYESLDVRGKIVLVLRHEPDEMDPESVFKGTALTDHSLFLNKMKNAVRHGAVGMLLVTDPMNHPESEDLRLFPTLSLEAESLRNADRGASNRERIGDPSFTAFQISRAVAERLVMKTGLTLAGLQNHTDSGKKPGTVKPLGIRIGLSKGNSMKSLRVTARNVAAMLPGTDPKLRNEWIVIAAHHDHLGSFRGSGDTIYNGADDNASGVSGVLALAEVFSGLKPGPARGIVFMTFSGEEEGLLGSRSLERSGIVRSLEDGGHIAFMINMDMIGRNPGKPVDVYGDGFTAGLRGMVEKENRKIGLNLRFRGREHQPASDHDTFFRAGIPVLFFFTGLHDDYHGIDDEYDRLSYEGMAAVVSLAGSVARNLASGFPIVFSPEAVPELIETGGV